jgi:hypothetical protein
MYRLGVVLKTKVGIALLGALVLGGGGTAMAMTTTHGQFFSQLVPSASGTHADDRSDPTKTGQKDNDDNNACANRTPEVKTTEAGDSDDSGTPGTHADTEGTPGTHSDAEGTPGARSDAEGTSSATHTAGGDDREGDDGDCDAQDHSPTGAHTPEPTERPDGTHTPEWTGTPHASPTGGHSGD